MFGFGLGGEARFTHVYTATFPLGIAMRFPRASTQTAALETF